MRRPHCRCCRQPPFAACIASIAAVSLRHFAAFTPYCRPPNCIAALHYLRRIAPARPSHCRRTIANALHSFIAFHSIHICTPQRLSPFTQRSPAHWHHQSDIKSGTLIRISVAQQQQICNNH